MYVSIVFRETTTRENYLRGASKTGNVILQLKVKFIVPHLYVVTCNNNMILIVRINVVFVCVFVCLFVCVCVNFYISVFVFLCGCGCGMSMSVCLCL